MTQELKKLIQLLFEFMNLVLERLLLDFWTCAPLQVKTNKQTITQQCKICCCYSNLLAFLSYYFLGKESATASVILNKMDSVLQESSISWINCAGMLVDNASVNLGKNNSIYTPVIEKNSTTFFMVCPCHILHNTSMQATESISKVIIFLVFNQS